MTKNTALSSDLQLSTSCSQDKTKPKTKQQEEVAAEKKQKGQNNKTC